MNMNIKSAGLYAGVKAYDSQAVQPGKARDPGSGAKKNNNLKPDEVILTNHEAEKRVNIVWQIRECEDNRQALVAELKERVQSGKYYVKPSDVVEKIIEISKGAI
jgi:anti-sigma28 factor (negative regulator of flagellin synthesis)